MASWCMPGRSLMALFTCTAKLDPGAHGARCAWAMAVHHAVGISRQRNSGYRPSRVNIMAQGLSTSDPSLSPTHLSIRRGRATATHYTHHGVAQHYISSFPGVAHWASLWGRPQCWHAKGACAAPNKKERKKGSIRKLGCSFLFAFYSNYGAILYRLRDIASYLSKIAKFLQPTCI